MDRESDPRLIVNSDRTVTVIGDELPYDKLTRCECDQGHKSVDTVCLFCYAHGRRKWNDPEVEDVK